LIWNAVHFGIKFIRDHFSAMDAVNAKKRTKTPTTFCHGRRDRIINT
jgi:hypothetical protein